MILKYGPVQFYKPAQKSFKLTNGLAYSVSHDDVSWLDNEFDEWLTNSLDEDLGDVIGDDITLTVLTEPENSKLINQHY